jgi:DNA-binding response OmpR family regulator
MLLAQPNTQHRLKEWWLSLNQEEQAVLDEVQKLQTQAKVSRAAQAELRKQYAAVLAMLREKGVLNKADRINGDLLSTHVAQMGGRSRGRLWRNAETDQIYQGQKLIGDLAPQEHALLRFMLDYPHARLTHDDIIEGVWPLEHHEAGLRTDALYQTVRGTRTKIEVNASDPRYLVTWRGQPEGGYQLFPEGKPSITEEWG